MYIPRHFRQEDDNEIRSFIEQHPFGIVISSVSDKVAGTHIPMLLTDSGTPFGLEGHFAAANPQNKAFTTNPECLVIFSGPHAYVSPSLYAETRNVPTWNFIAVHVYGRLSLIDSYEGKKSLLERSINTFDKEYFKQWATLDNKYRDGLINGMTGFSIEVSKVEAKYKLSQNRSDESRRNVTRHFEEHEPELGRYMKNELKD